MHGMLASRRRLVLCSNKPLLSRSRWAISDDLKGWLNRRMGWRTGSPSFRILLANSTFEGTFYFSQAAKVVDIPYREEKSDLFCGIFPHFLNSPAVSFRVIVGAQFMAPKRHQPNRTFAVSRRGGGGCRAGLGPLWPPAVPLSDRLPILCHTLPLRETPN